MSSRHLDDHWDGSRDEAAESIVEFDRRFRACADTDELIPDRPAWEQ